MTATGYNRRYRKAVHMLAGFPAFVLKHLLFQQMLFFSLALFTASWVLKPGWSWVRELAKPEDLERRYIAGVRHYFAAVFLLVALFGGRFPELATAGWLALAWGDGAAGLVGGKRSMKLPWNRDKTVLGFFVCIALIYFAIFISYVWFDGASAWKSWYAQVSFVSIAAIVSVAESLRLRIDDNYVVGLGVPTLLCAGTAFLHLW